MNIELNSRTYFAANALGQFEVSTDIVLGDAVVENQNIDLNELLDVEYSYYTVNGVFTNIQDWRELRQLCRQLRNAADRLERKCDATPIRENQSCSW